MTAGRVRLEGVRAERGTYALVLRSRGNAALRIGRLGRLALEPGFYVYVGSAFGPGGVRARVRHHERRSPRPHWHVDYLRRAVEVADLWYTHDPVPREHAWAAALLAARSATSPLAGFGASDCSCDTHLTHFEAEPSLSSFRRRLRALAPDHDRVQRLRPSDQRRVVGRG